MNFSARILTAIPSTEGASFGEFCRDLGDDKPDDKVEWHILFQTLESFEASGLIEISRISDRIDSLILTDLGAERAREALRER